jgi:hypothetical protein
MDVSSSSLPASLSLRNTIMHDHDDASPAVPVPPDQTDDVGDTIDKSRRQALLKFEG